MIILIPHAEQRGLSVKICMLLQKCPTSFGVVPSGTPFRPCAVPAATGVPHATPTAGLAFVSRWWVAYDDVLWSLILWTLRGRLQVISTLISACSVVTIYER